MRLPGFAGALTHERNLRMRTCIVGSRAKSDRRSDATTRRRGTPRNLKPNRSPVSAWTGALIDEELARERY